MSLAKYVHVPSFFCKALSVSSPKLEDLNINLLVFFQELESSPLGASKKPSNTKFFFYNILIILSTDLFFTILVSEKKRSCFTPKSLRSDFIRFKE